MKLIHYITLIISIAGIQLTNLSAQNNVDKNTPPQSISCNYKNISVGAFMDSLHANYSLHFSFDPSVVPVDSTIHVNIKNTPLPSVLDSIFIHQDIEIHIENNQVILTNKYRKTEVENYITVDGKIVSAENDRPLPLVNISLKGLPLGTTSNNEGDFKFLIPRKYIGYDLYFSSIGYQRSKTSVPPVDSTLYYQLKPTTIELKEIKIKHLKADDIINQVLANTRHNYNTSPMLLTAFFRESIKQDGKYVEVSEAILDIYKSSCLLNQDSEKTRFVKGRKSIKDREITLARLKLAGGPTLFAGIDIVKHQNFLPSGENNKYSYQYLGKEVEYDRVVYKIGFKPVFETDDIYYQGSMNIDTESFAIISADFEMTRKTLRKSEEYLIRKNAKKIKSTPVFTQYHIDYRPYGDKWLLNSVRGELKIKMLDKRHKKTKTNYYARAELLITDAQNGKGQKIKYSESFKSNYILADQITNYDEDFWKNYNIISPDENLQNVFKSDAVEIRIVPQLEKTKP